MWFVHICEAEIGDLMQELNALLLLNDPMKVK